MANHEHHASGNFENAENFTRIEILEEVCDTSLDMLDVTRLNDARKSTESKISDIKEKIILYKNYVVEIDNDLMLLKAKKSQEQQLLDQINQKIDEVSETVSGYRLAVAMKAKSIHATGVRHGKTETELMQKTKLDANEDTATIESIFNKFPEEVSLSIEDHKLFVEEYAEHRAKLIVYEQQKAEKEHTISEVDEQIDALEAAAKEVAVSLNKFELQLRGIKEQYVSALKHQLRIFEDTEEPMADVQEIIDEPQTIIDPIVENSDDILPDSIDTEVTEILGKQSELLAGIKERQRVKISLITGNVRIDGHNIKVGGQQKL